MTLHSRKGPVVIPNPLWIPVARILEYQAAGGCMEQAVIAAEALTGKQMIVKMESSKNI